MNRIEEIDRELAAYLAKLDELEAAAPLAAERFAKAKEAADAFEDTGRLSAENFVRERSRLNEARDVAEVQQARIRPKITRAHDEFFLFLRGISVEVVPLLWAKKAALQDEIWSYLDSLFSAPGDKQYRVRENFGVRDVVDSGDEVRARHTTAATLERFNAESAIHARDRLQNTNFAKTLKEAFALL